MGKENVSLEFEWDVLC